MSDFWQGLGSGLVLQVSAGPVCVAVLHKGASARVPPGFLDGVRCRLGGRLLHRAVARRHLSHSAGRPCPESSRSGQAVGVFLIGFAIKLGADLILREG